MAKKCKFLKKINCFSRAIKLLNKFYSILQRFKHFLVYMLFSIDENLHLSIILQKNVMATQKQLADYIKITR